jgi:hypothetical protein
MERNPNANKFRPSEGFRDLGWQLHPDQDDVKKCHEAGHKTREFDNSLFRFRCTDVITICDQCKHYYHTDMSD